eukprot:215144-Chlamydomonas_euryale.AAC.3
MGTCCFLFHAAFNTSKDLLLSMYCRRESRVQSSGNSPLNMRGMPGVAARPGQLVHGARRHHLTGRGLFKCASIAF